MKLGTRTIGIVTIEATEWKKENAHRVYFKGVKNSKGQACWDVAKQEWVKCHVEFAPQFKAQLKSAFEL